MLLVFGLDSVGDFSISKVVLTYCSARLRSTCLRKVSPEDVLMLGNRAGGDGHGHGER